MIEEERCTRLVADLGDGQVVWADEKVNGLSHHYCVKINGGTEACMDFISDKPGITEPALIAVLLDRLRRLPVADRQQWLRDQLAADVVESPTEGIPA